MRAQSVAVSIFIALPWLNPFAMGPAPAVVPWLISLACLALVLLWAAQVRLPEVAAAGWLAAALLSAAIGLLQYFGYSSALGSWVNSTVPGEAFANLRQRNQFATLTNIGLASLLWWSVQLRTRLALATLSASRRCEQGLSALVLLAAALLALGNAASSSRTGMMQLLLLLLLGLIWGAWRLPAPRRILLTALLAYGLATLLLPLLAGLDPQASGILKRLHEGDAACSSRLTLWSNVLHLIAQKPWLGWGWGDLDYAHFITLYPGARFCDILDNAHNLPLHLAVELGLPFALLVCALAAWLLWRTRPWREQDATRQLAWSVLALILLHSMLEYPLWYGPFQVAFGLCLCLLWRARAAPAPASGPVPKLPSAIAYATAMALLVAAAYAAWDYHRISQIYLSPEQRSPLYQGKTLARIGQSWLFENQLQFAQLTTTELTLENAQTLHAQALALLHFSPEPRVIEMLVESASLLGNKDEALFYLARYQAAFPQSYLGWTQKLVGRPAPGQSGATD
jgi:O-antigen ligase